MLKNDKIETYLGFCTKAGKITFGLDRMEQLKRSPYLLLADKTLSENSMRKATELAEKFHCPLLVCEGVSLGEILHKPACKAAAVSENNLAAAILSVAKNNENYKLLKNVGIGGNI